MYLEIPFVYMHERFILCMLRIHSKGKNNIAFVYDITLYSTIPKYNISGHLHTEKYVWPLLM